MDEHLRKELAELRAELSDIRHRLSRLESGQGELAATAEPPPPPLPTDTAKPAAEPSFEKTPQWAMPAPEELADTEKPVSPADNPFAQWFKGGKQMSLEQRLGGSWMNKIGIVLLVLGAAFFFHFAAEQGWVNETARVINVALAGVAMLGVGEWTWRKRMHIFAAGVTG